AYDDGRRSSLGGPKPKQPGSAISSDGRLRTGRVVFKTSADDYPNVMGRGSSQCGYLLEQPGSVVYVKRQVWGSGVALASGTGDHAHHSGGKPSRFCYESK